MNDSKDPKKTGGNRFVSTTLLAVALLAGASAAVGGCTSANGRNAGRAAEPQVRAAQDARNPAGTIDEKGRPLGKAERLERLALGVAGVQGATCVVFGKYAVVGIDVDEKLERSQVGTIKYAVAEAFRKDPDGVDAVVTADVDLSQRLREIGTDIRHGRPVAGFTEELADIIGRLVPQLPRSVVPAREPEDLGVRSSEPVTPR